MRQKKMCRRGNRIFLFNPSDLIWVPLAMSLLLTFANGFQNNTEPLGQKMNRVEVRVASRVAAGAVLHAWLQLFIRRKLL